MEKLPPLTEEQKSQYNRYRAEGMTPEKAIGLATKAPGNKYNPAIQRGVDKILFGENSLTSNVAGGVKEAFTGGRREYEEDVRQFGTEYANRKRPLTYGAAVGRGIGQAAFAPFEALDDVFGEGFSDTVTPVIEDAAESDVGQYLLNEAREFNETNDGVPGEIFNLSELLIVPGLVRNASARSLRETFAKGAEGAGAVGSSVASRTGRLADYLKPSARTNAAAPIEESLQGIERVLATKLDQDRLLTSLDEIKDILREGPENASERIFAKIEDIDLTPEELDALRSEIGRIDDFLKQDGATSIIEGYLNGTLDRVDSASGRAVSVIEGLSDDLIDRGFRTIENIREIPQKLSERAKGAVDRRIVRVTKNNPEQAYDDLLNLYKKAIVPGVKKKNKTIASIESINESIRRSVPDLAKKYDVEDLDDFARVISQEKKAIFSEIEKGLDEAGGSGRVVSMQKIVDELEELAKSERAEFSTPLRNAIDRMKSELTITTPEGEITVKSISPSGAQDLIADFNAQLQSYYRGSSSGTAADVIVDNLVVNNLRSMVDEVVDDLGAGSFRDLKNRYADLKRMEDDVVHRAVFEAQRGGRLSDLTDITSAADVVAGSLDPAFLARGATQFMTKEVINALTDKNELVRQMFLYGRNLDAPSGSRSSAPSPAPTAGKARKDPMRVTPEAKEELGEIDLAATTDFTKPFTVEGSQVNLFGSRVDLNDFESQVLADLSTKLEIGKSTTKSGNAKKTQPRAVFSVSDGKTTIRFSGAAPSTNEKTLQAFFHELGHAVDYQKGLVKADAIRAAIKSEGSELVRDRALRTFAPTIDKFDLDEKQIADLIGGRRVELGGGRYIPAKKKMHSYLRQYDEIFAEAYAMFRTEPERLRELAPTLYQEIDKLSV